MKNINVSSPTYRGLSDADCRDGITGWLVFTLPVQLPSIKLVNLAMCHCGLAPSLPYIAGSFNDLSSKHWDGKKVSVLSQNSGSDFATLVVIGY